jgi:hypothetical protein
LLKHAPRPIIVRGDSGGERSALSTLLLAQLLPHIAREEQSGANGSGTSFPELRDARSYLEGGREDGPS